MQQAQLYWLYINFPINPNNMGKIEHLYYYYTEQERERLRDHFKHSTNKNSWKMTLFIEPFTDNYETVLQI